MVVGTNTHGYIFGGYASSAWNDSSSECVTEDGGQFIFRLVGPGLGAEAWDDTGSSTWKQWRPRCVNMRRSWMSWHSNVG